MIPSSLKSYSGTDAVFDTLSKSFSSSVSSILSLRHGARCPREGEGATIQDEIGRAGEKEDTIERRSLKNQKRKYKLFWCLEGERTQVGRREASAPHQCQSLLAVWRTVEHCHRG